MQNSLLKHIFWQKLDGVLLSDCRCGLVTVGGCLVTASPIPLPQHWLQNHEFKINILPMRSRYRYLYKYSRGIQGRGGSRIWGEQWLYSDRCRIRMNNTGSGSDSLFWQKMFIKKSKNRYTVMNIDAWRLFCFKFLKCFYLSVKVY